VYITGGSSGLGRALAVELVRRGAHVTVVARDLRKLEETTAALKVGRPLERHDTTRHESRVESGVSRVERRVSSGVSSVEAQH
jgi:NAD(P)-dependent dehydrogenase (short-subunit alcohol dehydrogenase family)